MSTLTVNSKRSWITVGWLTIFLVGTDLFVVSPFLPAIGRDFGRMPEEVTILVSVFGVTYAIFCPLQARLAERIGMRKVLLGGVLGIGVANILTGLSFTFPAILGSRIMAGFAAASVTPMVYALAAERSPPQQRASCIALVGSGLVIALVLGAPLGFVLGSFSGWRVVFGILGATFILIYPFNSMTWEAPQATPSHAKVAPTREDMAKAVPLLACMVLWAGSVYATYTLLGSALETEYGLPAGGVAVALASFGLGAVLGGISGGQIADRIGSLPMIRLSFLLTACAYALLAWTFEMRNLGIVCANLFSLSLFAYGFFPSLQALAAARFSTHRASVLGLISSSLYVGITLGSFLAGRIFGHYQMQGVVVFSCCTAGAGVLLSLGMRRDG
ncbi:MFS transporter [Paraburkholderia aspalathi]|uniref:MFS transporter n=1 Tax=Paraburkholderia aspalathi TaxID=1324617 RepID=UPI0038BB0F01